MGREASCHCQWGSEEAEVKVLLETQELLVKGGIKRKVPFSEISDLFVQGEKLCFHVGNDSVSLDLGAKVAERWAAAITDPPSLAKKLGITAETRVAYLGSTEDKTLKIALSQGLATELAEANLLVAVARTPDELRDVLDAARPTTRTGVPIWVVYPKGKGKDISEAFVRKTLLDRGFVDTKVTSISEELTALRFSVRREKKALGAS